VAASYADALGEPLSWERLEGKRASRVALYRDASINEDDATLQRLREWAAVEPSITTELLVPRCTRSASLRSAQTRTAMPRAKDGPAKVGAAKVSTI